MLYIMRHGVTEWNALNKLQGRTDIPLNEEGRMLAKKAHDEYKELHIDVCFCSPLVRSSETAKLLFQGRDIPIIEDERLVEMGFGDFEGIVDYHNVAAEPIHTIFNAPEKYLESVGGTETFKELFARTGEFLEEKVKPLLQDKKDVLIVGHGAMNSAIICQLQHKEIKDFWSAGLAQCKIMKL